MSKPEELSSADQKCKSAGFFTLSDRNLSLPGSWALIPVLTMANFVLIPTDSDKKRG